MPTTPADNRPSTPIDETALERSELQLPSDAYDEILGAMREAGLQVSPTAIAVSREICRALDAHQYSSGRSPSGLAAAAVYAAAALEAGPNGETAAPDVTQVQLARATDVTDVTIRNHYKTIATLWAARTDDLPDHYEAVLEDWDVTADAWAVTS